MEIPAVFSYGNIIECVKPWSSTCLGIAVWASLCEHRCGFIFSGVDGVWKEDSQSLLPTSLWTFFCNLCNVDEGIILLIPPHLPFRCKLYHWQHLSFADFRVRQSSMSRSKHLLWVTRILYHVRQFHAAGEHVSKNPKTKACIPHTAGPCLCYSYCVHTQLHYSLLRTMDNLG